MSSSPCSRKDGEPLRVLHIGAGNLYGGVERLLLTLAQHRDKCPAMTPVFAFSFDGKIAEQIRSTGATVHLYGKVKLSLPWTTWRARRRLKKLLREERIDVVVAHGAWTHVIVSSVCASVSTPNAVWIHDVIRPECRLDRKSLAAKAKLAIANSQYTRGLVPDGAFGSAAMRVIYCPVLLECPAFPDKVRSEIRRRLCTPMEDVVITIAARWDSYKGHDKLVRALAAIAGERNWTLWIAGDTYNESDRRFRNSVIDEIETCQISDRVRLLGHFDNIAVLFAGSDIYCQPNRSPEPFGIVFVEAMLSGLLIVTSDAGGAREILADGCGMAVPIDDTKALRTALETSIDSEELRSQSRLLGPSRAKELCSVEQQLGKIRVELLDLVSLANVN